MLCFFFAGQKRGISDGKAKKPLRGLEEAEGRAKRASLTASNEQCSRACRDQRTARWAIRRKLPEQMPTRGADVEFRNLNCGAAWTTPRKRSSECSTAAGKRIKWTRNFN